MYELIVDGVFIGKYRDIQSAIKEAEKALQGGSMTTLIQSIK